jgi:hypothetical protein
MTDQNNVNDIIDIDPENVVEHKTENVASSPARKAGRGKTTLVLGAGLIVVSAVAGGWLYRDFLASYLPSDQVQAMATRVDTLEATSKTMSGKLDAVVGLTDEIKSQLGAAQLAAENADKLATTLTTESASTKETMVALQSALQKANAAVDDLKKKISTASSGTVSIDTSGLAARLDTVEKDLASLKQAGNNAHNDQAILSQALADLKAKIAAGTAYANEFERVKRMVPAADGLDVLSSTAAQGLPNTQGLANELKAIAVNLPKAEATPPVQDESWWGSAVNMMSGLITVKTAGAADWQEVANQSAGLAEQGDLGKAVSSLEHAEGVLPVELQKWHDKAAARLSLESALQKTGDAVMRQIAAKG